MRRLLVLALALAACKTVVVRPSEPAVVSVVTPPQPVPKNVTTEAERMELFQALMTMVEQGHVFAPATWENLAPVTFAKSAAELREVFEEAITEGHLLEALTRFGNSLHDPHLRFRPDLPTSAAHARYTLPILLRPQWINSQMSFIVTAAKARGVDPGDVLVSYAGVPSHLLLRTYADRSNANQWTGIAEDVGRWMTERRVGVGDLDEGASEMLELKKSDGATVKVELKWTRAGWHGEHAKEPAAPDYEHVHCAPGLPERAYPTYALLTHGTTFCLYTSTHKGYASLPILRFFSFDFGHPFGAEADYDHLRRDLEGLHGVRGIILDLRDNAGGNDPKWALDWFAPKPYLDLATHVRKTAWLMLAAEVDITNLDEGWMKGLARAADGATVSRFIGCEADDCTDTRQKPSRRILPVPVALVVGPGCNSACDHFARVFDENGLGPIVGEPSSAGLTVLRVNRPVVIGGKKLGSLGLAASLDYSPFTSAPVEGVPIHIDVPVTWSWAKRDTYDKELIDAAVGTLMK